MIPQPSQTAQYGAAIALTVQFIDPVATAANGGTLTPLDISGSSNLLVCLLYPDGTTSQNFTGTFVTNGTDGKIFYDTVYNVDLNQLGLYQVQGKVTKASVPILSDKGYLLVISNVDNVD